MIYAAFLHLLWVWFVVSSDELKGVGGWTAAVPSRSRGIYGQSLGGAIAAARPT